MQIYKLKQEVARQINVAIRRDGFLVKYVLNKSVSIEPDIVRDNSAVITVGVMFLLNGHEQYLEFKTTMFIDSGEKHINRMCLKLIERLYLLIDKV